MNAVNVLWDEGKPLWRTILKRQKLAEDIAPFISDSFFEPGALYNRDEVYEAIRELHIARRQELYMVLAGRLEKLLAAVAVNKNAAVSSPAWFFIERTRNVCAIIVAAVGMDRRLKQPNRLRRILLGRELATVAANTQITMAIQEIDFTISKSLAPQQWSAPKDLKEWCTVFNKSPNTMRKWFKTGNVRARRVGRSWSVDREEIPNNDE